SLTSLEDEQFKLVPTIAISIVVVSSLCGQSILISLVCIHKIMVMMKTRVMEIRTRRLHMQLFRALIIQFLVPVVFSFLPFTLIVFLPFGGISLGQLGNVCSLFSSLFPAIDPILIVSSVARFRGTLSEWFYKLSGRTGERNERRAVERSRIFTSMMVRRETDTL
ncbi:hypothetical protein PFISCL1PPCAC_14348, partial [Pristionchus fissidentatus]